MKMNPWLFARVLASLAKTFADRTERDRAMWHLLGARQTSYGSRKVHGRPGSGILHGRQNIHKTLTYRATYVPGGFNG